MDWYKKLFSFYYDEEYDQEGENRNNLAKDIEAKVAYQYPRNMGKITGANEKKTSSNKKQEISDIHKLLQKRRKRQIRNKDQTIPSPDRITQGVYSRRRQGEETGKETKKTMEIRQRGQQTRRVVRGSRPFSPTEIASPVFGYQKRKKKEVIEFELTAFEPENGPEKTQNEVQEKEAYDQREVYIHKKGETVHTETTENKMFSVRKEQPDERTEQPDQAAVREPSLREQSGGKLPTEGIQTKESGKTFLQQAEEKRTMFFPEGNREETDKRDKRQEHTEEERNKGKSRVSSAESVAASPVPKAQPERKRKPGRTTIPFNVLMLKQDRRYLKKSTEIKKRKENACGRNMEDEKQDPHPGGYQLPPHSLLRKEAPQPVDEIWVEEQRMILDRTLQSFHVRAKVTGVSVGPAVTRFELSPEPGVKVSKITNLVDDLKLSLAAKDIRIEAPIPGKHTIGIEVPNKTARPVYLRDILDKEIFKNSTSPLTVALGLDITGKPVVTDIQKMPHGLIAGATGSGKSVCVNTLITSILYKATPDEVKLLLIDPKMVELSPYNGIPHLISPVITDVKAATQALKWSVEEMERRYELFASTGVRDIKKYNEKADGKLPYIVIIIDELADLMMMAPNDVEEAIARIAQKARACGIHLIISTQRPSVDVITGLIKANIPTRIAFSVSSQVDSRTIIDESGAERLLGKGDMLFADNGTAKPVRIQGAFISDEEIERVVSHVRSQCEPEYLFEQEELIRKSDFAENHDELLYDACEFAVEQGQISTSGLQRHFRIGYNRAARIIDMMEDKGLISEARGSKPRDVLMTEDDLEQLKKLV